MAWLVDAESRRRGLAQLSCSKLCTWGRTTVRAGPCCRGMIPSAVDLVLLACLRRLRAYERGRGVTGCSISTRVCVPLGTLTLVACARVCFLSLLGEGVGTRCCCGGEPGSRLIVRSFSYPRRWSPRRTQRARSQPSSSASRTTAAPVTFSYLHICLQSPRSAPTSCSGCLSRLARRSRRPASL